VHNSKASPIAIATARSDIGRVKQTGRKTTENISKRGRKEKQNKMDCLCCLLGFAGDVVSHRRRGREE